MALMRVLSSHLISCIQVIKPVNRCFWGVGKMFLGTFGSSRPASNSYFHIKILRIQNISAIFISQTTFHSNICIIINLAFAHIHIDSAL